MSYEGLTLEKEAGVATLTLNRPEQLNAISLPMIDSWKEALNDIGKDDDIKAVIITGAGRAFCAGLDISAFSKVSKMSQENLAELMGAIALPLYDLSKATIAAINGAVIGAGLSIVMLCDLKIASEKAKFSSIFVTFQVSAGRGTDIESLHCFVSIISVDSSRSNLE